MLTSFRSADEAAGVLGHEMAHYQLSHHVKQARASAFGALLGLGAAKVLGAKDRDDYELGAELGAGIVGSAESRRLENSADGIGIQMMQKTGYNPQAMVDFYYRVAEKSGNGYARVPVLGWFASHPDMRDRIARLEKENKKFSDHSVIQSSDRPTVGQTAVVVVDPARTEDYGLGFGRGYYYCNDLSEVAKQEAEAALEKRGFNVLVSTQDVGPLTEELDLQNSEYGQYGEGRTPKGYFAGAENVFYVSAWVAGANELQVGDWRRQLEVSGLKVGVLLRQVDLRTRKQLLASAGIGSVNKISRVRIPLGRDDWNPVEVELNSEQNLAREAVAKAASAAAGKFSPQAAPTIQPPANPVVPVQPVPLTDAEMAQIYAPAPAEPTEEFTTPEPEEPEFGFIGVTDGVLQLGSVPITLEMTAPAETVEVKFQITDASGKLVLEGESYRPPRFSLRLRPEILSGFSFPLTLTATALSKEGAELDRTSVRLERR
jgi:hypothetical protein